MEENMGKKLKDFQNKLFKKRTGIVITGSIILLLFFCLTRTFYRQAIEYGGGYRSDLPAHIEFGITGQGYSIVYYIINILYQITGNAILIAALESIVVIATWLLTGKLIQILNCRTGYLEGCILALPCIFLTGIYIPHIHEYFYVEQLFTQPYHNITYFGMRLFAVCTMIMFVKMFPDYISKIKGKQWCLLTLFLTISTLIKPNFLLGFSFTLLLFLIKDFSRYKFEKIPFRNMILLGGAVLPSLIVLWGQAQILYGNNTEAGQSGLAIIWGEDFVRYGMKSTVFKLICSFAFPCLVLYMNRKEIKKTESFSYIMCFIQLCVCILFVETNRRVASNFYWGLQCAGFILFVNAAALYWKNIKEMAARWKYKFIGAFLLSAHVISSIVYFIKIFSGQNYYI